MEVCKSFVELAKDVALRGHTKESASLRLWKHSLGCSWCGNLVDADPRVAGVALDWGIVLLEAEKGESKL